MRCATCINSIIGKEKFFCLKKLEVIDDGFADIKCKHYIPGSGFYWLQKKYGLELLKIHKIKSL